MPDQPNLAQPPTFPDTPDIPAMPVTDTPQTPTPPPTPSDDILNIPPMIVDSSSSKKRSGRIIATILGILILVGAVGAGVILTREKQLFREKAVGESYSCPSCGTCTQSCSAGGFNWDGNQYTVPNGAYSIKNKCAGVDLVASGQACACLPISHITCADCEGYDTCDLPNVERYFVRGGSGVTNGWESNYCGTQQVDITWGGSNPSYFHSVGNINSSVCNQATATPTPTATATATATPTATPTTTATPTPTATPTGAPTCSSLTLSPSEINLKPGETQAVTATLVGSVATGVTFWTNNNDVAVPSPNNPPNDYTPPYTSTVVAVAPGTVTFTAQGLPLIGNESCKDTITVNVTGTLLPQCLNVQAYDTNWNLLTSAQLSALTAGSVVRFTVSGTPADQIDKAIFTINGVLGPEVTTPKPGTNEYYYEYTIPAGVSSFTVTAQIHHLTLGWF